MDPESDDLSLRRATVNAARAFARLGYMHGFGHISARRPDGILITPTRPPFVQQGPDDVLVCGEDGMVRSGNANARPIEVFLHLAVYRARPDVQAICRTHAPAASALQSAASVPPIRHGFGGLARTVAVFEEVDLVHDAAIGDRAAAHLGTADALCLRGNGVLTVGGTIGEAAARMWSLEERCTFDRLTPDKNRWFSDEEFAARSRWYAAEAERAWTWLEMLAAG